VGAATAPSQGGGAPALPILGIPLFTPTPINRKRSNSAVRILAVGHATIAFVQMRSLSALAEFLMCFFVVICSQLAVIQTHRSRSPMVSGEGGAVDH